LLFALLFGVISLLYATVGQAGGTAFLALMAFAAFPSTEMRPTALALNIVAAAYSTWVFNREKVVDWRKLRPLLFRRYRPLSSAGSSCWTSASTRPRRESCCFSPAPR
jgi:uncharacterized protein